MRILALNLWTSIVISTKNYEKKHRALEGVEDGAGGTEIVKVKPLQIQGTEEKGRETALRQAMNEGAGALAEE